jgi:hypothetical protein
MKKKGICLCQVTSDVEVLVSRQEFVFIIQTCVLNTEVEEERCYSMCSKGNKRLYNTLKGIYNILVSSVQTVRHKSSKIKMGVNLTLRKCRWVFLGVVGSPETNTHFWAS